MMNKDPKKRRSFKDLYNDVKIIYDKKYPNNNSTSIKAVLRCLFSYHNFKLNNLAFKYINKNEVEYNLNDLYKEYIRTLIENSNREGNECIEKFRYKVISDNLNIKRNKEIDPFYFLVYLLEKMHIEINDYEQNEQNEDEKNKLNFSIDSGDRDKMLSKLNNENKNYQNSPIFDSFIGSIVTELKCQRCENISYSFKNLYFVVYDLSKHNSISFDLIKDGLKYLLLESNQKKGKEFHNFIKSSVKKSGANVIHL